MRGVLPLLLVELALTASAIAVSGTFTLLSRSCPCPVCEVGVDWPPLRRLAPSSGVWSSVVVYNFCDLQRGLSPPSLSVPP